MNQDVKALPVVAYRWVPSPYWGDYVHSGNPDQADEAEKFGITVEPLVLKSDAESALAELRAEVERLRGELRAYDEAPAACYFAARIEALRQRADTAEARLERARGLLDLASQHVKSNVRLSNAIAAFLGEDNA